MLDNKRAKCNNIKMWKYYFVYVYTKMKKHRWWKERMNSPTICMNSTKYLPPPPHQFIYKVLVRGRHKWLGYNVLSLWSTTFTSSNDIAARSLGLVLRDRVLFSNAWRLRQNLWIPYPISETTTHRASLRFLCLCLSFTGCSRTS